MQPKKVETRSGKLYHTKPENIISLLKAGQSAFAINMPFTQLQQINHIILKRKYISLPNGVVHLVELLHAKVYLGKLL